MKNISKFIHEDRLEVLVILAILVVSLFLRVYKIDQYMTFLGDEGRDALMVKRTLVDFDIPLIGPPTSVGNMYLGPLYYYMMSLSMAIVWLNPIAAAVMVAVIGTGSVMLLYYLAREWFGKIAAVVVAVLYSLSPVNIIYSRSSWNPNPAPFFTLLMVLGFYLSRKTKNYIWLILSGTALAFAVQMHYLALILVPVAGVLWFFELIAQVRQKKQERNFVLGSIGGIVAFLVLMSPLVIFDFKHNFINYKAITTFFLGDRQTTVNLNVFNSLGRLPTTYGDTFVNHYITGDNLWLTWLIALLILVPIIWFLYQWLLKKNFSWPFFAISSWFVIGILGLSLYKQTVYDHYMGFFNPVPFLLIGSLFVPLRKIKNTIIKNVALLSLGIIFLAIIATNIGRSPLLTSPNNQLQRTQEVARFVINETSGKPFNFALIAKSNYDAAYQFYLDQYGHKPKQVPFEITDQLFVVCEDKECQPTTNAKYEIAGFGQSTIEYEKEFKGVKIYKLVHREVVRP